MDSTMAISGYSPSSMALPGMMSRTEQMMMPYINDYANYVNQMDFQNTMGIPMSVSPYSRQYQTSMGGNCSVFNMEEHLAQLSENQQRMQEHRIQELERGRQNALTEMAPMEKLAVAAEDLKAKIVDNEQKQIPQALAVYLEAIRAAYDPDGTADEETIMAKARTLYKEQTGTDLISDIKDNAHSSFGQGFINGATFGIFGQQTADETISGITNQEVSTTSRNLKRAGKLQVECLLAQLQVPQSVVLVE